MSLPAATSKFTAFEQLRLGLVVISAFLDGTQFSYNSGWAQSFQSNWNIVDMSWCFFTSIYASQRESETNYILLHLYVDFVFTFPPTFSAHICYKKIDLNEYYFKLGTSKHSMWARASILFLSTWPWVMTPNIWSWSLHSFFPSHFDTKCFWTLLWISLGVLCDWWRYGMSAFILTVIGPAEFVVSLLLQATFSIFEFCGFLWSWLSAIPRFPFEENIESEFHTNKHIFASWASDDWYLLFAFVCVHIWCMCMLTKREWQRGSIFFYKPM